MIEHGADINHNNSYETTPLMLLNLNESIPLEEKLDIIKYMKSKQTKIKEYFG
jgi:ankyrin repeat protein